MKQNGNMAESDWWEKFKALADMVNSNSANKQSPKTNADRIRAMSDEEMAEEIKAIVGHCANGFCGKGCPLYSLCYSQGITELDWIKQEAK